MQDAVEATVNKTNDQVKNTPTQNSDTIDMTVMAPGQIRVIKRNGTVVAYDESKISVAITKAFLAVEGGNAAASSEFLRNSFKFN